MTVKAILDGATLAESDATIVVEGNHYFPPSALDKSYFKPSADGTTTVCGWKGTASYYDVTVNGNVVKDAAWYYPSTTTDKAKQVEGYVAFYKTKVKVQE